MDVLLAGLKTYADIKIQQLRPSVDAAKTGFTQADAAERAAFQMNLDSIRGHDHKSGERAWKEAREAYDKAKDQYFGSVKNYFTTALELSISAFLGFRFRLWKLTPRESSSFKFLRVIGSLSLLRQSVAWETTQSTPTGSSPSHSKGSNS